MKAVYQNGIAERKSLDGKETTNFKEQSIPVSDRIFCWNECNGRGAWREQAAGSVF